LSFFEKVLFGLQMLNQTGTKTMNFKRENLGKVVWRHQKLSSRVSRSKFNG